jgi:uncharacterized protein HemX
MDEPTITPFKTWQIILGSLLILILFRFAGPLRFVILALLMLSALGIILYFVWKIMQKRKAKQAFEESIEGVTNKKIIYCDEQIEKNKKEAKDIHESIRQLKKEIEQPEGLSQQKKNRRSKAYSSL